MLLRLAIVALAALFSWPITFGGDGAPAAPIGADPPQTVVP